MPLAGIVLLNPTDTAAIVHDACRRIDAQARPRHIARIGRYAAATLLSAGHPVLALRMLTTTLSSMLHADDEWLRRYADSYRPSYPPHSIPWSQRISLCDAIDLAHRADTLYKALGHPEEAHCCRDARRYYDYSFADLYEVSLTELHDLSAFRPFTPSALYAPDYPS